MAHPKPPARDLTDWKARAALFAAALLAYANSFSSDLVQDAKALLTLDDRIRALTAANLGLIFSKSYWWPKAADGLYRPVTTLSLLFNYAILGNGQSTTGYHVVNFLLHAGNVWLVYALARRLLREPLVAFLAAALWAVHPIGTEAVTNIAGRADLLAAMAVLGGLLLYTRLDHAPNWWKILALFVIATAGVFSKENAAVLLGLMLLWDLSHRTRPRAAAYAAVAASLVVLWAARSAVLGRMPSPQLVYVDNPLRLTGFLVARWTAIKVIAMDLGLLVQPYSSLSCDRSYHQIALAGPSDGMAWVALAVVVALLSVVIVRYRRDPVLFFAVGFFAIAILPTSNLIIPIGSIMAERFLYLPAVGFAISLGAMVQRTTLRQAATIMFAIATFSCAARTAARNSNWHDNLALASTDVRSAPDSFKLHDMLAKSLYDQDPQRNLDQAIAEQERAWAILEPLPPQLSTELTPSYLGLYYRFKGDAVGGPRTPAGRQWYEKSAAILMRAREISRASEKAFDDTQRAAGKPLSGRGATPDLYLNLAAALLGLERYPEAGAACRYALGLDPRRTEAYDGVALAALGDGRAEDSVVAVEERGIVEGLTPTLVGGLAELYQKIPGAACAIQNGQLNRQCPVVARDLCRAAADLNDAFREARIDRRIAACQ